MLCFAERHFEEVSSVFPEISNKSIDDLWMILGVAILFSKTHRTSELIRALRFREIKRRALLSLEQA